MEKETNGAKKFILIIIIILLILVLAAGFGFIKFFSGYSEPLDSGSEETVDIEIPVGSSTASIAKILEENGLIADADTFKIITKITRNADYKAGYYTLSPAMSMKEIREQLLSGRDSADNAMLVIPEGYTMTDIAAAAEKAGACTADEFLYEAANGQFDYDFLQTAVQGEKRLEGYLYPDSYDVSRGEGAHSVINRMLGRFGEVYGQIVSEHADSPVLSQYDTNQIITVASMVEREAFLDADRAPIASVIYNRLNAGMKMQFNTTVEYILGERRNLTNEDIKVDSPYNTYLYAGLPPGPIASPGKASIEAAILPAETNYYYFVTSDKGDSSMAFSETYEQFLVTKEAWKKSEGLS